MPTSRPTALHPPLFISARLMAAVRIAGTSTIHIQPIRRDTENRVVWRYIIEDHDHQVLHDAADLRTGVGDHPDPHKAIASLLGFLGAAADAYRHTMYGHDSENTDLFPPEVTEWAYEHDDEITALALELDLPDGGHDDTSQP